ncbi:MAG TPA: VOC family protein [Candidatus Saccharimonadales bacterium]|nr:VOC family protein [Candidatus Saccharimonadales bacterium]
MELAAIIGDYRDFLQRLLAETRAAGIDLADCVQLDHIGYSTTSLEAYEQKKTELATVATLLAEPTVGGRPLTVFRLHEPIIFDGWRVDCCEITAPKPETTGPDGLNHGEFVIFDDLDTFAEKYKGIQFDLRSINREINPELNLQLPSVKVKFHILSIASVAYFRKKLNLMNVK